MTKTLEYAVTDCIKCENGQPLKVGDLVLIPLDRSRVPSFPVSVRGIVSRVIKGLPTDNFDNKYFFDYQVEDLGGNVLSISSCDVLPVPRCLNCCDLLNERVSSIKRVTYSVPILPTDEFIDLNLPSVTVPAGTLPMTFDELDFYEVERLLGTEHVGWNGMVQAISPTVRRYFLLSSPSFAGTHKFNFYFRRLPIA